ncbi:MAG: Uma2 family endonuclease [Elainellaceae cyanobacterium]
MVQPTLQPYFTLDEYLSLDGHADSHCELVNGILVDMPPESDENNDIAKRLLFELAKSIPVALLGYKDTEIEVSGRRATCRIPDLLVHSEESKAALASTKRATLTHDMLPPALVIEIVSPGQKNRDRDYRYKRTEYAARGVAEYWIVDPEAKQITRCRWENGLYEDTVHRGVEAIASDVAPSFGLAVEDVFA